MLLCVVAAAAYVLCIVVVELRVDLKLVVVFVELCVDLKCVVVDV